MDALEHTLSDGSVATINSSDSFRLRPYQAEMVEESLKSNIICVMDTGSGKTHIAIERTRVELETCQPGKLVWFLAPTVTLCEQQYEVFKANLPGLNIQMFSGNDNVEHWTEQIIWDALLLNVRIVLSTHQVLYDALAHAFVKMDKIALLIFDEAHNCTRKHPAHRIMSNFYAPNFLESGHGKVQLPRVLGLTASPVQKADVSSVALQQIEQNLCAIARTPKKHRTELLQYVHMPSISKVEYPVEAYNRTRSSFISRLRIAYEKYNLGKDPYIIGLIHQQKQGLDVSKEIQKVTLRGSTYCRDQLKALVTKAEAMAEELGISAAEWYTHQCIFHFGQTAGVLETQFSDFSPNEKQHLLSILQQLPIPHIAPDSSISLDHLSHKVELLIQNLVAVSAETPKFTGLVFVEQRVWVAALAEILSVHPQTRDFFRLGIHLGTSQSSKRKTNITALVEPKHQPNTLDDFRSGKINLIITTNVLEEGVDVSSCHIVICFERPKNLKSFIQRRGRARMPNSQYVIFLPEAMGARTPESWQSLEEEMKAAYLDETREMKLAEERELEEEDGQRFYQVPSTGALLTLDNALPHLHHFCDLLGSGPFLDSRPQYEFFETPSNSITARVILPISVDPKLRIATSIENWKTEKMARKDAAFEAYKALHLAGLVNDNLLPFKEESDDQLAEMQIPDHRPALVPVSPLLDPWPNIARRQETNSGVFYQTLLEVGLAREEPTYILLFTPTRMPSLPEILLYWNESRRITVTMKSLPSVVLQNDEVCKFRLCTFNILSSIHFARMESEKYDFPWMIVPCDQAGNAMGQYQLAEHDFVTKNHEPAQDLIAQGRCDTSTWGLVNLRGDRRKFIVQDISVDGSSGTSKTFLQAISLPKRRDFLHPIKGITNTNAAYTKIEELDAADCVVGKLPTTYATFALLFPCILHKLEVGIVAEILMDTLMKPLAFDAIHLPLIIRALTSSQTNDDDYQRLEFLGDCILKFIASLHLMADNLSWPESFLTAKKGKVVSNGFLARATLAAGLDKFVFTKGFTGAKWAPKYVSNLLAPTDAPPKELRSSKLIADVIESLIGASYVVGGFDKAFACIKTLLPLEPWTPIPSANASLFGAAPGDTNTMNFGMLETLIGYSFTKKTLLLEALTHASYTGPNAHCSYERLEFLGDAVLDYLISKRLYAHEPPLSHQKMHAIRTALVNASFLAFRMFETKVHEEMTNKTTIQPELQERALWQFLRSSSPAIISNREAALAQHAQAKSQILEALERDVRYPWHCFALIDAPKFLSDIVESVIGAIYIDTKGSIATCEMFVRRLGIIDCLEHILKAEVDCLHPKERLGHLAGDKTVKYERITNDGEANVGIYKCQVKVGEETVGGVVQGLKRLNAETIAACEACAILESGVDVTMECSDDEDDFWDAEDGGGVRLEHTDEVS